MLLAFIKGAVASVIEWNLSFEMLKYFYFQSTYYAPWQMISKGKSYRNKPNKTSKTFLCLDFVNLSQILAQSAPNF